MSQKQVLKEETFALLQPSCLMEEEEEGYTSFQPSRADQMSIKVDLTSEGDKGFNFAFVIPAASSFHDASPQNNSGISS